MVDSRVFFDANLLNVSRYEHSELTYDCTEGSVEFHGSFAGSFYSSLNGDAHPSPRQRVAHCDGDSEHVEDHADGDSEQVEGHAFA